jgi:hypothetical protein
VKKTDKKQVVSQEARSLALVADVAATVREGLHELVVRSGESRFGHALGELPMGGRRVEVKRPRVRSVDGRELPLPTWERLAGLDPFGARAYEQMLVGVATRQYARSLEPVGDGVEERAAAK